ncbi:hypothetical protein FH972_010547 [Carpinus fangiana]|uniref:Uncharacterized protein n=1 Tax=Carpinus fangiana TaxID=176857 RepID=A0A660KUP5_9ROSI|nr:hypothetical protein FH972_010547 [Carpinus fangiana]
MEVNERSDEGFTTPKRSHCQFPAMSVCPPPPPKKKAVSGRIRFGSAKMKEIENIGF